MPFLIGISSGIASGIYHSLGVDSVSDNTSDHLLTLFRQSTWNVFFDSNSVSSHSCWHFLRRLALAVGVRWCILGGGEREERRKTGQILAGESFFPKNMAPSFLKSPGVCQSALSYDLK